MNGANSIAQTVNHLIKCFENFVFKPAPAVFWLVDSSKSGLVLKHQSNSTATAQQALKLPLVFCFATCYFIFIGISQSFFLLAYIISKFQSKKTNQNGAQIVFTTHNTELLNLELLRKDQIYFVDKHQESGASELYGIKELSTRTTENIRKGYLLGKYGATPDLEIEEVE